MAIDRGTTKRSTHGVLPLAVRASFLERNGLSTQREESSGYYRCWDFAYLTLAGCCYAKEAFVAICCSRDRLVMFAAHPALFTII